VIIACTRVISRDGHQALWNHVRKRQPDGPARLIQGTENDLKLMVKMARAKGAKYGIRHYYLNPAEVVSEDRMRHAVTALGREFSFDPETAVIVAHDKPRAGNTDESEHWHVLVPEVNAITGKTLDAHNFKRRNEKISRTLETAWGHQIIKGRHNLAVVNALVKDGSEDVARELVQAGITDGDPAFSAYSSDQRRTLERKHPNLSMPALTLAVQDAWRRADNMKAFQSALSENGMRARLGDKKAEWIVEVHDTDKDGWGLVGGLKRLVQERKNNIETRITDWEKSYDKKNRAKKSTVAGGRHTRNPRGNDGPEKPVGTRQQGLEPRGVLRTEVSNRDRQPVEPAGGEIASRGKPHSANQESVGIHRGRASAPRRQAGPFDRGVARQRLAERIAISRLNATPMKEEIAMLAVALRNGPQENLCFSQRHVEQVRTITAIPHRDRSAFRASLIRKAYHLNWLPESVVQNIKFVKVDADTPSVTLTLTTGTRIIDTGDRISLVGEVDDVSVDELVACITRRGWKSVELTGDDEFRREATRRLMRLVPPVEVKDNPLDPLERSAIRIEMAGDVEGVDWESVLAPAPAYRPRSDW
jgi:hypothetical protein